MKTMPSLRAKRSKPAFSRHGLLRRYTSHNNPKNGFTLFEMIIVIGVIALIMGAIATSRTMIRNAQLQSVATEYQTYFSAVKTFQDKYKALPGDFAGAEALWGASSNAGVPIDTETGAPNGNGNGYVDTFGDTGSYETFYAWLHLSKANILSNNTYGSLVYAYSENNCDYNIVRGVTAPASKLKSALWWFGSTTPGLISEGVSNNGHGYYYGDNYKGVFYDFSIQRGDGSKGVIMWLGGPWQQDEVIGSVGANSYECSDALAPVLTGNEAYQLDLKLDDGEARTGFVRSGINNTDFIDYCYTNSTSGGYSTVGDNICSLAFLPDF